jgi:acetyl esterase/lipase
MRILSLLVAVLLCASVVNAAEPLDIWPDLAPGETTREPGTPLPARPGENPAITRVENITRPTLTVHRPQEPNGTAVVILPGGGFARVVPDLEGTEAAAWLNEHGVTAFVLSYRTTPSQQTAKQIPGWVKPLQDAQRALALVRSRAKEWDLDPERVGLLGFSAGGQVAARLLTGGDKKTYDRIDAIDEVSHRPAFAILIYPWNMYDAQRDALVEGIEVGKDCPPTYIVHTDDDRSSSLGAVLFYAGLKKQGIPAELHVYGNGGHGYGLRPVKGSEISTWPTHAAHWLGTRGLLKNGLLKK